MKLIGDNAMLVDIQHVKEDRRQNTPEMLYIVWKDLDTMKKYVTPIENPTMDIFFEKRENRDHMYPKTYVHAADCNKVTVQNKNIINAIIEDGGEATKTRAKAIFESKQYSQLDEFLKYPYVYGADLDIRSYYRYKWLKKYDNDSQKVLHTGFMDIETDFLDVDGVADPKTCPIDLITLVDSRYMKSYTFALVGREYNMPDLTNMSEKEKKKHLERDALHRERIKQEKDLIAHQNDVKRELHEMFDDTYGCMDYNFYFYKDEKKMLVHIFELINKIGFDFVAFWNFEFDVNYLLERAVVLGLDPTDLFCHKDFPIKKCWFKRDNFHFAIKNKTDYFFNTGYTNYICQMRIYASTRKNKSELRSYSLNYVGKKEVKDTKVDYSELGSIKTFSYKDYKRYFIYNIKDVLLQHGIEQTTHDITNYYMTSYQTITPLDSVFKQTVKLRCVQYLFYRDSGLVPGMNINKTPFNKDVDDDDDDDDSGFEGALVGDSRLNSETGVPIYGDKKTNSVFKYAIDMDMSAFYPSTIKITNNEASNLIFKCHIDSSQFNILDGEKPINTISHIPLLPKADSDFSGDVAKECFDNLFTQDWLSSGHKWFNLPTMDELYDAVEKKLSV